MHQGVQFFRVATRRSRRFTNCLAMKRWFTFGQEGKLSAVLSHPRIIKLLFMFVFAIIYCLKTPTITPKERTFQPGEAFEDTSFSRV